MKTLILVPTDLELRLLALPSSCAASVVVELCGFGPVAAGVMASRAIARHEPSFVINVGIAGAFQATAVLGKSSIFDTFVQGELGVRLAEEPLHCEPLSFPQWQGATSAEVSIGGHEILKGRWPGSSQVESDALRAKFASRVARGPMLSVSSASGDPTVAEYRHKKFPSVVAEDMESYAIAFACRIAQVPFLAVRGFSNHVGDRKVQNWKMKEALADCRVLVSELVGEFAAL